jgi:hypothetical protein
MARRTKKTHHKLSAEQLHALLVMIAEHRRPGECVERMRDEHGVSITDTLVCYYKRNPEYREMIHKLRASWEKAFMDETIASKRWRLEQLERLYVTENRYRTTGYARSGGTASLPEYARVRTKPVGELRALLRQAAEEVGGLNQKVTVDAGDSLLELLARAAGGREAGAAA